MQTQFLAFYGCPSTHYRQSMRLPRLIFLVRWDFAARHPGFQSVALSPIERRRRRGPAGRMTNRFCDGEIFWLLTCRPLCRENQASIWRRSFIEVRLVTNRLNHCYRTGFARSAGSKPSCKRSFLDRLNDDIFSTSGDFTRTRVVVGEFCPFCVNGRPRKLRRRSNWVLFSHWLQQIWRSACASTTLGLASRETHQRAL